MLVLGVLVIRKGIETSPLRPPIAILSIDMFIWNFAMLGYQLTGNQGWRWLDNTFSPFTPALAMHIVLIFVGKAKQYRYPLILAYLGAFSLSIASFSAFFSVSMGNWILSSSQSAAFLILMVPETILMAVLLIAHIRNQCREEERMRARLLLLALFMGAFFGSTEHWDEILPILPLPTLGQLGALLMAVLVSLVVIRMSPSHGRNIRNAGYSVGLALVTLLGLLAMQRWLKTDLMIGLLASIGLFSGLVFAVLDVYAQKMYSKASDARKSVLSQLSAELADEVKSPLATVQCALDYLKEECRRDGTLTDKATFFSLAEEQLRNINHAVDTHRHFLNELKIEIIPIDELFNRVIDEALSDLLTARNLRIVTNIDSSIEHLRVDVFQTYFALEILLRDIISSISPGSLLHIKAFPCLLDTTTDAIGIHLSSNSQSIESSWGLSSMRRVIEAHGGEIRTKFSGVIELLFPAR